MNFKKEISDMKYNVSPMLWWGEYLGFLRAWGLQCQIRTIISLSAIFRAVFCAFNFLFFFFWVFFISSLLIEKEVAIKQVAKVVVLFYFRVWLLSCYYPSIQWNCFISFFVGCGCTETDVSIGLCLLLYLNDCSLLPLRVTVKLTWF